MLNANIVDSNVFVKRLHWNENSFEFYIVMTITLTIQMSSSAHASEQENILFFFNMNKNKTILTSASRHAIVITAESFCMHAFDGTRMTTNKTFSRDVQRERKRFCLSTVFKCFPVKLILVFSFWYFKLPTTTFFVNCCIYNAIFNYLAVGVESSQVSRNCFLFALLLKRCHLHLKYCFTIQRIIQLNHDNLLSMMHFRSVYWILIFGEMNIPIFVD